MNCSGADLNDEMQRFKCYLLHSQEKNRIYKLKELVLYPTNFFSSDETSHKFTF